MSVKTYAWTMVHWGMASTNTDNRASGAAQNNDDGSANMNSGCGKGDFDDVKVRGR